MDIIAYLTFHIIFDNQLGIVVLKVYILWEVLQKHLNLLVCGNIYIYFKEQLANCSCQYHFGLLSLRILLEI